ncbi:MAG TPA: glycosyltransferase family 4 protein [Candidatus Caccomonas pullistercoris]|nr:glycosyltransferase family 4 protein [Candidatus Caccomonas pullistercoris]
MKLVYCISATHNSGGMERVLATKANYLVARGYDITVVTTDQRGLSPFFPLDARIRCVDLGVNYETNNGKSFLNKLVHFPFKQWRHRRRLSRVLREIRPDVTVSMFCNDATFLPSIKDGSRKVLEIHFSRFKRLQYDRKGLWRLADVWRNRNEADVVARFDRFVVLTHEDSRYWGNQPHIAVIPNAQTFTSDAPAPLEAKTVVAVGRLTYQKGFDLLLQAWAEVYRRVSGWQLAIVGDGELRSALSAQAESLGLAGCVTFVPATKDVVAVYRDASVLAMSSRYEGFGMVLLEAQTVGLPVVSFACKCGPSEIVNDGVDGYLVAPGDVDAMADRLVRLMQDGALRRRMGARAFANAARFSTDAVMKQWMALFDSLKKD